MEEKQKETFPTKRLHVLSARDIILGGNDSDQMVLPDMTERMIESVRRFYNDCLIQFHLEHGSMPFAYRAWIEDSYLCLNLYSQDEVLKEGDGTIKKINYDDDEIPQ